MASRRFLQKSTLVSSAKSFFSPTSRIQHSSSNFTAFSPNTPAFRLSHRPNSFFSSRIPVELSCATESLMPLHSATASSLLRSMLSSKVGQWGTLSEGFATPL